MKSYIFSVIFSLLSFSAAFSQNSVTYDPDAEWLGFMNVFNLDGGYEFGSQWGVADVSSLIMADGITLRPNYNTYADNPGDAYWIDPTTGEGAKVMEGLTFVEPGAFFNGVDLTFSGTVSENTFGADYSVKYFIKALNPNADFSDELAGSGVFDLPSSGGFSVTIPGESLTPGLIIQYGFSVMGRNANPNIDEPGFAIVTPASLVSTNNLNDKNDKVEVFPNPANDMISIRSERKIISYDVTDLTGQVILRGTDTKNIDISNLPKGTYILSSKTHEGTSSSKFVKG
jgi:hypothetical protein